MGKLQTCFNNFFALLVADGDFFVTYEQLAAGVGVIDAGDLKLKVPIMTQQVGNIQAAVQQGLQKVNVGLVILLPAISRPEAGDGLLTLRLHFSAVVTENPMLNKTGKSTLDIIEEVSTRVDGKPNGLGHSSTKPGRFVVDKNAGKQLLPSNPSILAYAININTQVCLTNHYATTTTS